MISSSAILCSSCFIPFFLGSIVTPANPGMLIYASFAAPFLPPKVVLVCWSHPPYAIHNSVYIIAIAQKKKEKNNRKKEHLYFAIKCIYYLGKLFTHISLIKLFSNKISHNDSCYIFSFVLFRFSSVMCGCVLDFINPITTYPYIHIANPNVYYIELLYHFFYVEHIFSLYIIRTL